MDFEKLLSDYKVKACIMSVDKLPDGRYGNIRTAMCVADERMYADKKAYYDLHPEKKYR